MVINKNRTQGWNRKAVGTILDIRRLDEFCFAVEIQAADDDLGWTLLFTNEEMVRLWKAAESL